MHGAFGILIILRKIKGFQWRHVVIKAGLVKVQRTLKVGEGGVKDGSRQTILIIVCFVMYLFFRNKKEIMQLSNKLRHVEVIKKKLINSAMKLFVLYFHFLNQYL